MSDIQPGDLVVCVDVTKRPLSPPTFKELVLGRHYRVNGVRRRARTGEDHLLMVGCNRDGLGWRESRFHKIDAADEQFTALIRACKPINSPVLP